MTFCRGARGDSLSAAHNISAQNNLRRLSRTLTSGSSNSHFRICISVPSSAAVENVLLQRPETLRMTVRHFIVIRPVGEKDDA